MCVNAGGILYQSVARPGLATGCDKAAYTTASKSARLRVELLDEDEDSIRLKALVAEMQAMVGATLDFARGAAVQEAAVQVDLAAVWADLVSDAAAGEGHATLAAAQPVPAAVHLTRLKRALRNLIDNAIRYGDVARVTLTGQPGLAIITIADDGPGPSSAIGPKTSLQRYSNPSSGSKLRAAAIPAVSASALPSRAPRCRRMAAMSPCATAPKADWRRWCACRLIRLKAHSENCVAVLWIKCTKKQKVKAVA